VVTKVIACFTLGVLVAAAIVAGALVRPDLSRATLRAKYADARSRFVTLPDGSVAHVRVDGPSGAPTIVLLHGAMISLQSWDTWSERLSEKYRVVRIDAPGHGLTGPTTAGDYSRAGMVAFVHAVLKNLGVGREAMVGHSMGGGVAAEYAERYPDEVWGLVLVDASGIPRSPSQGSGLGVVAHNPLLRPILRWSMPRWLIARGVRKAFADPTKATDAMIDRVYDLVHYPGNRAGLIGHYLAPSDDVAVEAGLPGLKVPTLIEWGAADGVLPVSSAREFQRRIPNATLVIYEGVGHVVPEELPEQSAHDAADFLAASLR
jgi:pimeloyl-ACP methyl ester carboxylesterase